MPSSTWRAAALFAWSVASATACDHEHSRADPEVEATLDETSDGITDALDHAAGCDAYHVSDTDDGSGDGPPDDDDAITSLRGQVPLGGRSPVDLVLDSALRMAGPLGALQALAGIAGAPRVHAGANPATTLAGAGPRSRG